MNELKRKERRKSERFAYKRPIRYMVMGNLIRPPDEAPVEGSIVDLSNGGMKIKTSNSHLAKGAILKVMMPVGRVNVNLPLLAEVRWRKEEKPGAFNAGLMFMV